eukprot:CAMPEP_0184297868 /NCGR_PEP_ID=MMETSP1049-20130417/8742_1 /TAXON_ID=77928 /ORGANISM="Proteomonas sulcata, Strain CCMP704" /LENGTH=206 /DNA_ID=CAMNT_0026607791 /DNA_START=47 /DNA_END=667 /DNA_ORIENTATION=-
MKACVVAAGVLLCAAEASAFASAPSLAHSAKVRSGVCTQLRMQEGVEGAVSRRALLSGLTGAALLSGVEGAQAKDKDSKPIILESGLAYVEKKKNSGVLSGVEQAVGQGTFVIVDYIAYLRDGTIFDNTKKRGKPAAFQIGKKQVIPGLEEGMLGMKAGEERQLFVPAKLGYGSRGVCIENKGCLVPPDTDLVYDVTLIRVAPPPI